MTQILVSEELYPQMVFTILRSMWNVLTCPLSQIICYDNTWLEAVRNIPYKCSQGLVCWAPSIMFTAENGMKIVSSNKLQGINGQKRKQPGTVRNGKMVA